MKHCSSSSLRHPMLLAAGLSAALAGCTARAPVPAGWQEREPAAQESAGSAPVPFWSLPLAPPAPATAELSAPGGAPRGAVAGSLSAGAESAGNLAPSVPAARLAVLAGVITRVDAARGLLRFASDPDGDRVQVAAAGVEAAVLDAGTVRVATELGGALAVAADGSFAYEPPPGVVAELDRAPFQAADGRGARVESELLLSVTPGTLQGQPGFEIGGSDAEFLIGGSVTGVGDFDGDGLDDVLVVARSSGRDIGHLLLGSRAPGHVDLSAGDSIRIIGETAGPDSFGVAVSPAGHINDDELADFIIGVHQEPIADEPEAALGGKAYVIFGTESPPDEIDLATLAADRRGFVIQGAAGQEHLGFSVAGGGNVDGSGGDDLLIGAVGALPTAGTPGAESFGPADGRAYVVFGKSGFTPVDLANLGEGGYRLDGEAGEGGQAGAAVTGLGDWNGDGLAELAVSAPRLNADAGRIYVAYGRAGGGVLELGDIAFGLGGFAIDGQGGELAGQTLQNGGNLGGSELAELIIGMPNPAGLVLAGKTVVVYGKADGERVQLAELEGGSSLGFVVRAESEGDRSGLAVAGPGDFNGDGAADLLIGAAEQGPEQNGAAYLLYGSTPLRAGIDRLADLAGLGRTVRGASAGALLGFSAAAAGDVNGDGYPDVILGAPGEDGSGGRAYVLLGHP